MPAGLTRASKIKELGKCQPSSKSKLYFKLLAWLDKEQATKISLISCCLQFHGSHADPIIFSSNGETSHSTVIASVFVDFDRLH